MKWSQYAYQIAAVWIGVTVIQWGLPRLERKVMSALRTLRRKMKRAIDNSLKARVVRGETISIEGNFALDEPRYQPRPIDPENPPKVMFYRPKRPDSMAFCTNCGDALERGDKVLVFPGDDSHPIEIICEGCVKKS